MYYVKQDASPRKGGIRTLKSTKRPLALMKSMHWVQQKIGVALVSVKMSLSFWEVTIDTECPIRIGAIGSSNSGGKFSRDYGLVELAHFLKSIWNTYCHYRRGECCCGVERFWKSFWGCSILKIFSTEEELKVKSWDEKLNLFETRFFKIAKDRVWYGKEDSLYNNRMKRSSTDTTLIKRDLAERQ